MALVIRYFSTSAVGAGDGTTWADRAALFVAGNWSTVISGFNFTSDSLECRIEGGLTYTCSQALSTGVTGTPDPTIGNQLILHGCDSSGNRLAPTNPNWTSDTPVDWDGNLPVIATTTNILTVNMGTFCHLYHLRFTASGRQGGILIAQDINWVTVLQSTSNTNASGIISGSRNVTNTEIVMSGTAYSMGMEATSGTAKVDNVRIEGNLSASSGNRRGMVQSSNTALRADRVVSYNHIGAAFYNGGAGTSSNAIMMNCIGANSGVGCDMPHTSSTSAGYIVKSMFTGNLTFGVSSGGVIAIVMECRFRDNATADINGIPANYPTDLNNYTTDAADSDDYVNAAAGDFRIKLGSAIHGMGFGVSDEPTIINNQYLLVRTSNLF